MSFLTQKQDAVRIKQELIETSLNKLDREKNIKRRRYTCNVCNLNYTRADNLRTHMNIVHLKIKRYKCTSCDYATYFKNRLDGHMNTHKKKPLMTEKVKYIYF